jgi:hypothetical protein
VANQVPNTLKKMIFKGDIVALTDVFKIILMQPGFVFDPDVHHAYADVLASEVANGLGYATAGKTLGGIGLVVDNTENRAELTWNNVQWDATGGTLAASGAIIYDDTTLVASGHDETDAIIAYIDAGGVLLATDGTPMLIQNIMVSTE